MCPDAPDDVAVSGVSASEWKIAGLVSSRAQISVERATNVVAAVFDVVARALLNGDRVEVRGFGTFAVREYQAYRGRNPRTGVPVDVRSKRKPVFKTAKELRLRLQEEAAKSSMPIPHPLVTGPAPRRIA